MTALPQQNRNAVVLLSGGLDSATVLAIARKKYNIYAISFDYGQRNRHELSAAKTLAMNANAEKHLILKVDLRAVGGSALTDDIDVPVNRRESEIGEGIPITYVPARNTVFLSLALAWAETLRAKDIFIGVNAIDYSGYPDCRPEFIEAFENLANVATCTGIENSEKFCIHTPLLRMSKKEIILKGAELGVDYSIT
ncbi:MAG: 7-cyano-7-deazaguanine synthase QueC, partial [FCB group bacterium]|nr:7-cyano-7-deazaguanine synthase QueC [FCB group bacterium]